VNTRKQNYHIKGTVEYKKKEREDKAKGYPSPTRLRGNLKFAQSLVDKYAGSGRLYLRDGDILPREKIKASKIVGKFWNAKDGKWKKTKHFTIVYSRSGAHIFPTESKED
jgi:hypothetical protein